MDLPAIARDPNLICTPQDEDQVIFVISFFNILIKYYFLTFLDMIKSSCDKSSRCNGHGLVTYNIERFTIE